MKNTNKQFVYSFHLKPDILVILPGISGFFLIQFKALTPNYSLKIDILKKEFLF